MRSLAGVLCAMLVLLAAVAHGKATVVIVNADPPDAGFNDPTPVAPVGGNCGTTLGAQRLVVFEKAAEIWGNRLESAAPITILSNFQPLTCNSSGATLGSAGATNVFASDDPTLPPGVPGSIFPKPHTWYVSALSAAFAGRALVSGSGTDPANFDIQAHFNSTLDDPRATNCHGFQWYYGLDNNHGGRIDLLTVVLHEFGHGLGFISYTDPTTGAFMSNEPDIWASFLYDEGSGKHWLELTDTTRAASAISAGLAWDGPTVTQAVPDTLAFPPVVRVTSAPNTPSAVKDYDFAAASFGAGIPDAPGIAGALAVGSTGWGCSSLGRLDPLDGRIAILNRGGPPDAGCTFVEKARNAQDAGAVALLIANNIAGAPSTPGTPPGDDARDVVIPVVMISQADGTSLESAVAAGPVQGLLTRDPSQGRSGADSSDRALMYAPTTFQAGSTVSHWDVSAFPNLLMEPVINGDLTHTLDLTPKLLHDIGWTISDAGAIPDGSDPVVCAGRDAGADAGGGGADGGGGGGGGNGSSSGCTTALGSPAPWLALLGLLALVRRRRRA
jgi:MYXO-CTERM domain-containing protein